MRVLSKREERRILRNVLRKMKFMESGSSRIVVPFGKDKIVKVALQEQSLEQNKNEIEIYKEYAEILPLGKIYAYGERVILMERLYDPFYFYNEGTCQTINEDYNLEDYYFEFEDHLVETVENIVEYFQDIQGYTGDNWQLGVDKNGNFKSYDYGYTTRKSFGEQVGSISSISIKNLENKIQTNIKKLSSW